jgi:O-acetyl-ADP-ribose deacetylase (regulator of RNase III)
MRVVCGDITTLAVDAIVNAANESLLGGGGVDGAIHAAAGPSLLAECRRFGGCQPGEAKITAGYNLPALFVIHTVAPRNGDPAVLKACYEASLSLAIKYGLKSIAFPCLGTGVFGFPKVAACEIAIACATRAAAAIEITFCCFSEADAALYRERL